MKLVDILARELKEWPESADSLSQSFGGMVFYISSVVQLKTLFRTEVSEDWREAMVFKPQWQAAVDALKAEKVVEWNGDGLPPTDAEIEWFDGEWLKVLVVGSHKGAVVAVDEKDPRRVFIGKSACYRPIRTPEQIEAERYEEDAAEIAKILSDLRNADDIFVAKTLLDCGYRKFEIVDN